MIEEIKQKVASKEYNFLRENEHLGKNIILLGLGGSMHTERTRKVLISMFVVSQLIEKKKYYQIFVLNSLLMKKRIRQFIRLTK